MKNRGFTMVEVLVSIAIAAVLVSVISFMNFQNIRLSESNILGLQANLYAMEAMEIVRDLEISDWAEFDQCQLGCHPQLVSGSWGLYFGDEEINGTPFTRQMVVEDVERGGDGEIVASGGTPDSNTRKVSVTVSWSDPFGDRDITVETFVHAYDS